MTSAPGPLAHDPRPKTGRWVVRFSSSFWAVISQGIQTGGVWLKHGLAVQRSCPTMEIGSLSNWRVAGYLQLRLTLLAADTDGGRAGSQGPKQLEDNFEESRSYL